MQDGIWRWDATRMVAAVARREVSCREVVEACLWRQPGDASRAGWTAPLRKATTAETTEPKP